ncbi:hypothetical protein YC2023_009976 [Brassica napus]
MSPRHLARRSSATTAAFVPTLTGAGLYCYGCLVGLTAADYQPSSEASFSHRGVGSVLLPSEPRPLSEFGPGSLPFNHRIPPSRPRFTFAALTYFRSGTEDAAGFVSTSLRSADWIPTSQFKVTISLLSGHVVKVTH